MNYEDVRTELRSEGWLLPSEESMKRMGEALNQAAQSMSRFVSAWQDSERREGEPPLQN